MPDYQNSDHQNTDLPFNDGGERTRLTLPAELLEFQQQLGDLAPRSDRLDFGQFYFLAGQQSVAATPAAQPSHRMIGLSAGLSSLASIAATVLIMLALGQASSVHGDGKWSGDVLAANDRPETLSNGVSPQAGQSLSEGIRPEQDVESGLLVTRPVVYAGRAARLLAVQRMLDEDRPPRELSGRQEDEGFEFARPRSLFEQRRSL